MATESELIEALRGSPEVAAVADANENREMVAQEREAEEAVDETLRIPPGASLHTPGAIVTRLSTVKTSKLQWLWPDRIPFGKLSVLDGDPGLGKSLISSDLAARVSIADTMPDGANSDHTAPAGVVFLSAEDDPADTIRPRLEAAGADVSQIALLSGVRQGRTERLPTLFDLDAIRHAIDEVKAKLVIIDPLMAYLPSKIDSHKDQDIRSTLTRLAKLAAETEVAVLIIRHLNKAGSGKAIYRGGGSIGIVGAARSALLVAKDPDDEERRILALTKSNLAKLASALAYRVETTENGVPRVKWLGNSQHTADSLVSQPLVEEEQSALEEAKTFLSDALSTGAVSAKDVQRQARNAGISDRTLRRAKDSLGIKAQKRGGFFDKEKKEEQRWCWVLPTEDGQDPAEDGHKGEFGHLQQSSEKNLRKFNVVSEDSQSSENGRLQDDNGHLQGWEDDL